MLPVGLHAGVSAAVYHADPAERPSLSSSVAKLFLDSTPRHAWTVHPRLNPGLAEKDDPRFDLGSVAHELILGRGGGYTVVEAGDWRTKGAQETRKKIVADGQTPILQRQWDDAVAMAKTVGERIAEIPECRPILDAGGFWFANGIGERVGIWEDVGGALCRMMIDWHGPSEADLWDIKTTGVPLTDDAVARLVVSMGHDLQAAFYIRGVSTLLPEVAGRVRWRWIFVQDAPPYEVRVLEPSAEMLEIGDRKAALSIEKWRQCVEADEWPGYPPIITRLEPPAWATDRWLAREQIDEAALTFHPMSRAGVQGPPKLMEPV